MSEGERKLEICYINIELITTSGNMNFLLCVSVCYFSDKQFENNEEY